MTLLVGTKSWFADPASATSATNEREERKRRGKRRGKREHMKRRREEKCSMLPILGFHSILNIFSNSWNPEENGSFVTNLYKRVDVINWIVSERILLAN